MENIVNSIRKEVKTINIKRKFDISFILILLISIILSRNQICLANNTNQESKLLNLKNSKSSKSSATTIQLDSKKGSFYIQISGNGKTTKRLIKVELASKDITKTQTVKFSEENVSGYSDNHNFQIITSSSKTKKTGDYYTILTMEFSYTKPAHYMSSGEYSNKVDGYRFNFKEYTEENEGKSTINNTGHNIKDTTEKVSLQINVANCGINQTSNQYKAKKATGIINLSEKYYSSLKINPNGGIHNGHSETYKYGTALCDTTVNIQNPTKSGYEFMGWTLSKGSYCTGANFNFSTNQFTYCGKSTTTTDISDNNTCILKANWKNVYGTITIKPIDMENNMLNTGQYSLYDSNGNLKQTLSIEKNGQIMFTDLPIGKYMICEDKIQKGYELSKIIEQEITETNLNVILEIAHKEKEVLPEAGGKPKDLIFISNGIILIIILNKKRRKI